MKAVLIALIIATGLTACTTARRTGEGSALPRETASPNLAQQELLPDPQRDRERYWSLRDFATPRGLFR